MELSVAPPIHSDARLSTSSCQVYDIGGSFHCQPECQMYHHSRCEWACVGWGSGA